MQTASETRPSLPTFLSFALGPRWSVHDRVTDRARARQPNPVRRREYEAAKAAYVAQFGEAA